MADSGLTFQVLSTGDFKEVYDFAMARLAASIPDENERAFASWTVKWRKEALEHYLRLGWSFIARDSKGIVGFFLAQPFLFFRGQTQTVWVEHVEAVSAVARIELIEVAVKVSREKHMQRILFCDANMFGSALEKLEKWPGSRLNEDIYEIKTTKG